jgi:hypothetical protein
MKWWTSFKFKLRCKELEKHPRYELRFMGTLYNNDYFVSSDIYYNIESMRTYIRSYNNAIHTIENWHGIEIYSLGIL